jgi:zinc and cadmium transporter
MRMSLLAEFWPDQALGQLPWILGFGLLMSLIALVGAVTVFLSTRTLERILLPLVAFAAGSLIGGALFHMIPEGIEHLGNSTGMWVWLAAGFLAFFCLEQFL